MRDLPRWGRSISRSPRLDAPGNTSLSPSGVLGKKLGKKDNINQGFDLNKAGVGSRGGRYWLR